MSQPIFVEDKSNERNELKLVNIEPDLVGPIEESDRARLEVSCLSAEGADPKLLDQSPLILKVPKPKRKNILIGGIRNSNVNHIEEKIGEIRPSYSNILH